METYVSEQEQVEQLRRWWKSNGQALVLGLALGLGGLAAYRYWDASRDSQAMNASINYEAMVQMTAAQKLDDAASAGRTIIEAYPDTLYARLSGLLLAKIAVQKHDYEAAKKELQALLAADGKGEIADIARTRLARLLLAEGKAEEAGKPAERLKHMRMALYFEDGIEKKHRGPAKRSVFALEVSQGEYAAALDRFRELMKDHGDELSVPEKLAGEQLEALVAGPKAIATPGELECRCDKENGEPLWSARLLRREFGFIDIEGEVERFEVRCETKQFAAKVAADKQWKIPPSWGDCTLFVFGAEGAKFRVVEMPEQVASVEAPAPATP